MLDPASFALYLGAAVAMILSPGPDTIYVLTRSVGEGRRTGVASAAGIGTGVLVHTLGAVLGLAALFRASDVAFRAVTYLGGAYLLYLGVRTIRRDGVVTDSLDQPSGEAKDRPPAEPADLAVSTTPFREAVAVNVLNPQVALFFLAFLPQFVDGQWIEAQLALLGGTYAALTLLYLTGVALAGSALRRALATRPVVADALRWFSGLVLVGLGLRLFLGGP